MLHFKLDVLLNYKSTHFKMLNFWPFKVLKIFTGLYGSRHGWGQLKSFDPFCHPIYCINFGRVVKMSFFYHFIPFILHIMPFLYHSILVTPNLQSVRFDDVIRN